MSKSPPQQNVSIDDKYLKLAKAIEAAEISARNASKDVAENLKELGISVQIVSEHAQDEFGKDTTMWGVGQWKGFESMLRNPADWEIIESEDDVVESDEVELDESDAEASSLE